MKKLSKIFTLLLLVCVVCSCFTLTIPFAFGATTPTGYTSAEDVVYKTSGSYVANWGARGETATFLTKYAKAFYTGNNTIENFATLKGGSQSSAPSSALYSALKTFMTSEHDYETSYGATRDLFRYTDCERNDTAHISSFYSGKELNGAWDSGKTWNREHTWPDSKGLNGNDENDIMMLRPTWVQENSSRGNTAYGESSGYYDPNSENPPASLRGDCARICLYVYTRWGNSGKMWGSSGVMQSIDVLLKWMAEDPVDTWELGRNDAVQAITGTRNVFVDYPELAWLLFDQQIPQSVATPSGYAKQFGTNQPSTPTTPSTPTNPTNPSNPTRPTIPSNPNKNRNKIIWTVVGVVGGTVVVGGAVAVTIIVVKRRKKLSSQQNDIVDSDN